MLAPAFESSAVPPPAQFPPPLPMTSPAPMNGQPPGEPSLAHLKSELQKAENATKQAAAGSGAFLGIFARYSLAAGYGYIQCAEVQQQYNGAEAQIQREQYLGLQVGDSVVFKVNLNEKGAPQATFARRVGELTRQRQRILEVEAPLPAEGAVESQEFLGFVSSFQADPGFGFISCAQTRQVYGTDVYIHRDQFTDMGVGDAVNFRVALNPRGSPVARSVRRAGADGEASRGGQPGAAGAPGLTAGAAPNGGPRARSRSMSDMDISASPSRGGGGKHTSHAGPPVTTPPPATGFAPVAEGEQRDRTGKRSTSRRRRRSSSSRRRSRSRRSGRGGRDRRRRSSSRRGRSRRSSRSRSRGRR